MWKQTIPTTMQEFGDYCKNMVQDNGSNGNGISITLRDTRDNNTYTVARLKDGKCWMTQNLRIHDQTISSNDSDLASGSFTIPNASNFSDSSTTAEAYYRDNSIGTYYNWLAATANTGKNVSSNNDAEGSVCPKGWKIPTKDEFSKMISYYNYSSIQQPPANFIMGGYGGSYHLILRSNEGRYHTSTCYKSSTCNGTVGGYSWLFALGDTSYCRLSYGMCESSLHNTWAHTIRCINRGS